MKNAITVIDQELLDELSDHLNTDELMTEVETLKLDELIQMAKDLIEINAELTKRDVGATQALKVWADKYEKLQSENAELKEQANKKIRKVLCDIGTEFENDTRINKKSMPFVRAIIINKIYDYPTPPEGE